MSNELKRATKQVIYKEPFLLQLAFPSGVLMNRRVWFLGLGVVTGFLLALPSALAEARIDFTLDIGAHPEMPLPENGKRTHVFLIKAAAKEFSCAQKTEFGIALLPMEHPKWAGASLNPSNGFVKFEVAAQHPGLTGTESLGDKEVRLEVEWDVESRPKTGARHEYVVRFDTTSYDAGTGTCAPTPVAHYGDDVKLAVTMPDVVEEENVTADCAVAPELPECQTAIPAGDEGGSAPGLPAALAVVATLAVAVLARRRRQF